MNFYSTRFEDCVEVLLKIEVFWHVTLYWWVYSSQCYEGAYCATHLQNVRNCSPLRHWNYILNNTGSHPEDFNHQFLFAFTSFGIFGLYYVTSEDFLK